MCVYVCVYKYIKYLYIESFYSIFQLRFNCRSCFSQNIAADERIMETNALAHQHTYRIMRIIYINTYLSTLFNIGGKSGATDTSDRKFIKLNSLFIAIKARINIDCLHLCVTLGIFWICSWWSFAIFFLFLFFTHSHLCIPFAKKKKKKKKERISRKEEFSSIKRGKLSIAVAVAFVDVGS